MVFDPHFLSLAELLDRKGSIDELLAYLLEEERDPQTLLSLRWAEGRFRSLVKSRYGQSLPADPASTPDEIKGLVADLARYHLELEHTDNASPNVVTLGERALAQLRDVAVGRRHLADQDVDAGADDHAQAVEDQHPESQDAAQRRL